MMESKKQAWQNRFQDIQLKRIDLPGMDDRQVENFGAEIENLFNEVSNYLIEQGKLKEGENKMGFYLKKSIHTMKYFSTEEDKKYKKYKKQDLASYLFGELDEISALIDIC